jgi:DNA/RNA endonuclease YhcR with UshA esterase domain
MVGDNSYKPGEIVKVSGIYSVVHEDGEGTFEVTCVEGEHFPLLGAEKARTMNWSTVRCILTNMAS